MIVAPWCTEGQHCFDTPVAATKCGSLAPLSSSALVQSERPDGAHAHWCIVDQIKFRHQLSQRPVPELCQALPAHPVFQG